MKFQDEVNFLKWRKPARTIIDTQNAFVGTHETSTGLEVASAAFTGLSLGNRQDRDTLRRIGLSLVHLANGSINGKTT